MLSHIISSQPALILIQSTKLRTLLEPIPVIFFKVRPAAAHLIIASASSPLAPGGSILKLLNSQFAPLRPTPIIAALTVKVGVNVPSPIPIYLTPAVLKLRVVVKVSVCPGKTKTTSPRLAWVKSLAAAIVETTQTTPSRSGGNS